MNSTILYIASYNQYCKDNNYENHYNTYWNNMCCCIKKFFSCKCLKKKIE